MSKIPTSKSIWMKLRVHDLPEPATGCRGVAASFGLFGLSNLLKPCHSPQSHTEPTKAGSHQQKPERGEEVSGGVSRRVWSS